MLVTKGYQGSREKKTGSNLSVGGKRIHSEKMQNNTGEKRKKNKEKKALKLLCEAWMTQMVNNNNTYINKIDANFAKNKSEF